MTKRRIESATSSFCAPPAEVATAGSDPIAANRRQRHSRARVGRAVLTVLVGALLVQGCTLLSGFRLDVQQGNVIEAEKLDQVQVGMTERQVQFLLGSPVLNAAYRESDRWDYVYYRRPGFAAAERARATIHFTGGRVERIDRDVPSAEPDADPLAPVG